MQQQPDADNPSADSDAGPSAPDLPPSPAERVIAKFGGIRPMASKLGIAVTTVQGWKERGTIPARRQAEITAAAQAAGITVDPADFATDSAEHAGDEAPAETVHAEPVSGGGAGPWRAAGQGSGQKEPPTIDAPPQPNARLGGGRTALWIVIVLVLAAGAGGAGWWYGRQHASGVDLTPLENRLGAAEQKLASLPEIQKAARDANTRAAAAAASVTRLEASLKRLDDRLTAVESRVAQGGSGASSGDQDAARAALDAAKQAVANSRQEADRALAALRDDTAKTVASLKDDTAKALADMRAETTRLASALDDATKRIAALEASKAAATADGARLAALVAALGQLRQAVQAGRPYAAELKTAQTLSGGKDSVPPALTAHAEQGVMTAEALRDAFTRRAAAIVNAASKPADADWLHRALHGITSLVTVRRTGGDLAGDSADAVVGRAERQLKQNDLAGAVATLGALSGPAADAASSWLADARTTLGAVAAVKALQDAALARVAEVGGTSAGGAPQ